MSQRSPEGKDGSGAGADGAARCPICGKPQAPKFKPFCSKRCADVDLSRWLKGNYAIAAEEDPDDASSPREGEGDEG